jgi:hypothetical protein
MSVDDKPFGTPKLASLLSLLEQSDAKVEATYGPVNTLATEIIKVAYSTQQSLADVFGFSAGGEASLPQVLMFYEFLYFFSHLTLRTLAAHDFTEPQIQKWQNVSTPLLSWIAVDSFFLHWPQDHKAKMRSEYYDKLNDAELEYSECRGLISPDDPLSENALIGRLCTAPDFLDS